jgi:hypothetical protein
LNLRDTKQKHLMQNEQTNKQTNTYASIDAKFT